MTDDRLTELLRAALPPAPDERPAHDLWPAVARRFDRTPRWSYVDLSLAAAAAIALAINPEWLWLLAYHL